MTRRVVNLNQVEIDDREGTGDGPKRVHHAVSGSVQVLFDGIEGYLCRAIASAPLIVGCVAWLTNRKILEMLSKVPTSLLVQKEDFLRPDCVRTGDLRRLYERGPHLDRYDLCGAVAQINASSPGGLERVRCVGPANVARSGPQMAARMHHKFIVLCRMGEYEPVLGRLDPYAVITGSFNYTHNSTRSFENIVVISDRGIARAYAREWQHVLALSEPCDWATPYMEPEFRIGT